MKKAAVLLIYSTDTDMFLLLKRSQQSKLQGWCLPGGVMEEGETGDQCAWREALEETGIQFDIQKLLYVGEATGSRGETVYIYRVDVDYVIVPELSAEHEDALWTNTNDNSAWGHDVELAGNTAEFIRMALEHRQQTHDKVIVELGLPDDVMKKLLAAVQTKNPGVMKLLEELKIIGITHVPADAKALKEARQAKVRPCPYCNGTGHAGGDVTVDISDYVPCPQCEGTGEVQL
jgi:ADP-ribose pyrophosphatase YjhB (NUDIX family)